jgi:excisionase family DNA binding protein
MTIEVQPEPSVAPELLISVRETCRRLACSRTYLHKLRVAGRLVPIDTGGRMVRYRRSDVEDFADGLPLKSVAISALASHQRSATGSAAGAFTRTRKEATRGIGAPTHTD